MKFLIVDTWNGEGYSDSSASVMNFSDVIEASNHARKEATQSCQYMEEHDYDGLYMGKVVPSFYMNKENTHDMAWTYSDGEDAGAVHFTPFDDSTLAVMINPCVNEYEVITDQEELDSMEALIKSSSFEIKQDDAEVYGQCHHGIGNDGGDIILLSREMLMPTECCTPEHHLEFDMDGKTDGVEYETWKCKQCNKQYNVPMQIVRDFDNITELK